MKYNATDPPRAGGFFYAPKKNWAFSPYKPKQVGLENNLISPVITPSVELKPK